MKQMTLVAGWILVLGTAQAMADTQWTYSGDEGPENWGELSEEFVMCAEGVNQSPIDIRGPIEAEVSPLQIDYGRNAERIVNNGHTLKVEVAPGSQISLGDNSFALKQYHFHSPSENLIEGQSYPLEAHLVHANDQGSLAVIGVMFEDGEANPALAQLIADLPEEVGMPQLLAEPLDASELLPESRAYYRFNGSLTTPPCTEGVRWYVMKEPLTASPEQIEALSQAMPYPNNRPVQPINARPVLH